MPTQSLDEIIEAGPQAEPSAESAPQTPEAPEAPAQAETLTTEPQAQDEGEALPELDAGLPENPHERYDELHRRASGFKTAAISERQKRQARDAELAELRQQVERMQQPQPQAQAQADGEILDPILDPEGYSRSMHEQMMNEVRASNFRASCAAVEEAEPEKYQAAYSALDDLNPNHPIAAQVLQRLKSSPNPGRELLRVYDEMMSNPTIAPEIALHAAMSDPAKRRELAAVATGTPAQAAPQFDPRSLPTNLAGTRSVGRGGAQGAWTGQKPLAEILGEKR